MGLIKKKEKTDTTPQKETTKFKITKSQIKKMYDDDRSVRRNVNKTVNDSVNIEQESASSFNNTYYNLTTDLEKQRKLSTELYTFYPIYSNLVDYLSNMYTWQYVYIPRIVKDKKTVGKEYAEIYNLMGEVVDGLNIETAFPLLLTHLFIDGALYLLTVRNTSSKTITTLKLPYKYCRISAITQYGTHAFQFDFSYFDSLGLNKQELETIFEYYPKEMKGMYAAYKKDTKNMRWQDLDAKYAAGFSTNSYGFPTKLRSLFTLKQYDEYLSNELTKSSQQLEKIIAHQMPTWEDRLVIDMDEMTELHQSMSKVLTKNKNVRLLTTFGELEVLSIGKDDSKENKTLTNAYNAIYDNLGENHSLFTGESAEALKHSLSRDGSIVWKYIQQLVSFYNLVINNSFNFSGYQCDLTMLPITIYNQNEKLLSYKDGATLGTNKLEYIVASGVKQVNIASKIELEDYLQLDKLKPLSTSYTQNDNSKDKDTKSGADTDPKSNPVKQEEDEDIKEQEVKDNE